MTKQMAILIVGGIASIVGLVMIIKLWNAVAIGFKVVAAAM